MSTPGDYMLDPPDDPPMITCPECGGSGFSDNEYDPNGSGALDCSRCSGEGEAYATEEEVRDWAAERQIERAEARRDEDL